MQIWCCPCANHLTSCCSCANHHANLVLLLCQPSDKLLLLCRPSDKLLLLCRSLQKILFLIRYCHMFISFCQQLRNLFKLHTIGARFGPFPALIPVSATALFDASLVFAWPLTPAIEHNVGIQATRLAILLIPPSLNPCGGKIPNGLAARLLPNLTSFMYTKKCR